MEHMQRRFAGSALGACTGLVFGLVSQFINHYVVPGVAFYQPPFGPIGNTALFAGLGGLVGLATAWPQASLIASAAVSFALSVAVILLNLPGARVEPKAAAGVAVGLVFLLIPFFGMFFAPLAVFRWVVNKEEETRRDREPVWVWARLPALLLLLGAGVGATALLPEDGRVVIARMNALMRAGQAAAETSALPKPLQAESIGDFRQNGTGPYALEWTFRNLQQYEIPYGLNARGYPSAAIARFESGWGVVCLYPTPQAEPECKAFARGALQTETNPFTAIPSVFPLAR